MPRVRVTKDKQPMPDNKAKRTNAPSKKNVRVRASKPERVDTYRPAKPAAKTAEVKETKGERIAKIIARAGLCSRRDAERWIAEGRVQLDGKVLDTAAVVVKADQIIVVDGQPLPAPQQARVWRFHKPKGVITTRKDPEGRPTVFDGLPADLPRLEPVGRLDFNSEGLLLFTNDGELKRKLELPSTGWSRRYRVRVHGRVDPTQIKALEKGITVEGVNYGPIQARLEHQAASNAWIAMTLREGKNREIRRICEHLGLTVNRLIRVSYGPFQLSDLEPGKIEAVPARILRDQLGVNADVTGEAASPAKTGDRRNKPGKTRAGKPETSKKSSPKTGATKPASKTTRTAKTDRSIPKGATDLTDSLSGKARKKGGRSTASKGSAGRKNTKVATKPKAGERNANRRRTS